jgi:hypothetical protein
MPDITVAIINESTVVADADVAQYAAALQVQVSQHFAPAWGVDANIVVVPKVNQPPAGSWWLVLLDDTDQAGALGYHDVTSEGLPMGKVFAKTDLDNHLSVSVTISHELLEMLGDPDVNLTTFIQSSAKVGRLYAYEVCDAVEDDQYGYAIDGVTVSDFVLPAYFEPSTAAHTPGVRYDYGGHLNGAVPTLLSGGYIGEFDVSRGSGWTQKTAATEGTPHRGHLRMPHKGGRSERRRRPRDQWQVSQLENTERLVPM